MDADVIDKIFLKMIEYDAGDANRIQHFTKVHEYARLIGWAEDLAESALETLEIAAILHDIGIHEAERLYGSSDGKYQEELGPGIARDLLEEFKLDEKVVDRVCYLIAHHHTYDNIESLDYQILVEADLLVNMYEGAESLAAIKSTYDRIFKTETGKRICRVMFGLQ